MLRVSVGRFKWALSSSLVLVSHLSQFSIVNVSQFCLCTSFCFVCVRQRVESKWSLKKTQKVWLWLWLFVSTEALSWIAVLPPDNASRLASATLRKGQTVDSTVLKNLSGSAPDTSCYIKRGNKQVTHRAGGGFRLLPNSTLSGLFPVSG